jgi:hypothetical protein
MPVPPDPIGPSRIALFTDGNPFGDRRIAVPGSGHAQQYPTQRPSRGWRESTQRHSRGYRTDYVSLTSPDSHPQHQTKGGTLRSPLR